MFLGPRACCGAAALARGQDRSLANILRSLHVSALAFFLFSYHVHEKGILPLYPLLPLSLAERDYAAAFSLLSAFTLLPLLHYEGLALAYGAAVALYVLAWYEHRPRKAFAAFACLVPLHFMPLVVPPPARYPDASGARRVVGRGRLRPRLRGGGAARETVWRRRKVGLRLGPARGAATLPSTAASSIGL